MLKQQTTVTVESPGWWSFADLGTLDPNFVHPAGPQYDGVTCWPGQHDGRGQAVALLLALLAVVVAVVATLIYY